MRSSGRQGLDAVAPSAAGMRGNVTSSKTKPRPLRTALLALGVVAGCGGSASRGQHDAPASSSGATASDPTGTAGAKAVAGSAVALPSGGTGTSAGGTPGSAGSQEDLGGMAGADTGPELSLPPGCEPRTPLATADTCSLAVDCDGSPSIRTYCYRTDSGRWECQCANQERIFQVEDVAGLQACALSAGLCADDSPKLGEEICEPANDVSDQDSCKVDVACRQAIELGAATDAQAWLMRTSSVRCTRLSSTDPFGCSCSSGAQSSNYALLADSGELACGPLADFCITGEPPAFEGKERCSGIGFSSDGDGCQRSATCGAILELTDGVSLFDPHERFASCAPRSGGGSECSCFDQESAFLFRLSTPPDDASCESALPNCDPAAVIKTTGPASCEPRSLDVNGPDRCQSLLGCVQDATVDERSIVAESNLALVCARSAAGMPWWCSCASALETARFQLGAAGSNAAQACNQAPAGCLEHLSLQIGPTGDETGDPPEPLP